MKNFKRMLTGTALVTSLVTSAIAGDCGFSGFYMGTQFGYGNQKISGKGNGAKINLASSGIIGGLHAGYGKQFPNRFYVGLEAYGNLANQSEELKGNGFKVEYKKKYAFGTKLRPGVVFGNAMFYGIAGIEYANFELESNAKDKSKSKLGFAPGVGISFSATDHIIVGLEATHAFYQKVKDTKVRSTDAFARVSYKW